MSTLKHLHTEKMITLQSHHVFGRHVSYDGTHLDGDDISQLHAAIRWDGVHWIIFDYSRNGTWLDGHRLGRNKNAQLKKDANIQFGSNRNQRWVVVDIDAPKSLLVPLDKQEKTISLDRFHVLPNEQEPEVSIFIIGSGHWVCESGSGQYLLEDGDIVSVNNGQQWIFRAVSVYNRTIEVELPDINTGESFELIFSVSSDEEHVTLSFKKNGKVWNLGERAHHYFLLILARQRLHDIAAGIDDKNQGWIYLDDLLRMLGMEQSHLNIQIYRARKQVQKTLKELVFVPQLVERRAGSVRIGCSKLHIK